MNVLILRSIENQPPPGEYTVSMNTAYADRFISHITNASGFCTACGKDCIACREGYKLDFSHDIAGVVSFPARLPVMIDDPESYIPSDVPPHDVLVAISVHEEILLSFIERFQVSRGIIIPSEAPGWISPYAKKTITDKCAEKNIEVAFPKPFCSFSPSSGILREFRNYFRVGKPRLNIHIEGNSIRYARVECSAPCGATYYTARGLTGKSLDEDLVMVIDTMLSSYPCTASTEVDREFQDSIIHQAVKIQRSVLSPITHLIPKRSA